MRNVEGAKAGSNQKKPYRAPVSVTSTQRMRIKYGISEGTIRGFSAEFSHNEMLKRIYLDGTPIMSAEGEQLLDVVVEFRDGSRDQEPINGLPSISVEHDVGVEVKVAAPVSRSFDRSDTTSYDVRISVPTLYQGDDEGNSNKGLIQFKIDVSTDGGAFEEAGRFEIYEKILNGFAETYNVVVPKGSNHVVRISRLNSEVVSDYSVNRLVVEAITENTDVRLRYTNTAVLYLEYDAEQFSNVPKLEMRVFGKNDILVPANYNGDTHTYVTSGAGTTNGVWDGTWKRAYTDNPVWIALDLMISRRYGLGDKIDLTFINKWELYGLAQYCDEAVADGKGGLEPRFTCNNMYLQKSEDAYRVLKDLAASFRAKVVWDGEFITLQADIPRDPVHTFSNANASDITYSSTQDSAQRNLINVQYYDRDNKFASDVVMQRSNSNILSRGKVVDGNFTALGCASQGQAQRIASYVMNTELYETELVSFTTGLEGGLVRLNDVIQMADNSVAGQTVGGRIAAVNGRSITLDRKIPDNVQAIATTQLSINRQDVKNEPISIVSISDDRMTAVLASDAPAGTEAGLVWALLTQDLVPQKFVVTDIEFDSTNMTFAVSAIQYNESKYAAIDGSARIVVPPISVTEYKMLKAPIIVIASYLTRIIQDAVVCDIDVSWAQSTNAVQYQLEMQKAGSDWRIVGRFMSLATTLDNMYTGTYTFRVCAYDSLGNASQYTYSDPILVAGKVLPPPMLTQYNVIGILFGYQHKWTYPAHTEDSRAVRLRFTTIDPVESPVQEWQYVDVAYPTANFTEQDVTAHLRTWFSAAIVDKYGNVGAYTAWLSVVPSSNPAQVLDLLDGQLTAQQLDQDLTNKIAIGAEAALAAESAQNAADAAAQAATNAHAAAAQVQAQVTATTAELRGLLDITADGLTQEILDRQEGDADVVGQLTTYKTSNDAAMSAVQQKAEAATSASSANATALTNLNTEVAAAHNLASNALQQAQSATDATSTNASNLIALNSRMDSAVQAGDNLLVNSNVDKPYIGTYPHGTYALGESWEVGATYTLLWCASFVRKSPDQNILVLAVYAGGGLQAVQYIGTEGERQVHEVTFVVRPEGAGRNEIHFYLLNSNGGYLDAVATVHWAVLVKASDISTKVWVRSKYDVDNAINANAQAIRNTETAIATVDGKVNAQATDILNLSNGLTNLNNTKLDASVISNYYTRGQADDKSAEIAAGKIESYDAKLVIGGTNLLLNSDFSEDASWAKWGDNGGGYTKVSDTTHGSVIQTNLPNGLVHDWVRLENNVEYTYSALVKPSNDLPMGTGSPLHYWAGKDYTHQAKIHVLSTSHTLIEAGKWTRISIVFKLVDDANTFRPFIFGLTGVLQIAWTKLELGNKATDWSPNTVEIQQAINANTSAIQSTSADVSLIDGRVAAQATDILNLNSSLTNLNNTKLDASIIQQYRTAVDQDSVTTSELTQFKSALKMGGDNLFTGTKTFNNQSSENSTSSFYPSYGGFGGSTQEFLPNALFGTHTVVKSSSSWCGFYLREADGISWEAQEDMVLSFWANASADVHVYGIASQLGLVATIPANQPLVKYEVSIPKGTPLRNAANQGIIEFYLYNGGELWYGAVMLQVGTKSTSWQPSSKDNDVALNSLATAIAQTDTRVSNTEAGLSAQSLQVTNLNARLDYFNAAGRNYLLDSKNAGTKEIHPDINVMLAPNVNVKMSFDIDIRSPFQVSGHSRVGFESSFYLDGANYYFGVWLYNAYSKGVGKFRVYNTATIPSSWIAGVTSFPSVFPYYVQTEGGDFTITNVKLEVGDAYTNWTPAPEDNASANALTTLDAKVTQVDGKVTALAVETNTLSTTVGNNTASIQLQQSSINGLEAKATLQVEAGGTIGGVALGNNGGVVDVLIRSNTFAIAPPVSAGAGDAGKYAFNYRATPVTLPNGTVIPTGLYLNNLIVDYIDASKIYAESLSAVSANLGTFTTANEKGTMKIAGTEISVKDINGVERIYIGL